MIRFVVKALVGLWVVAAAAGSVAQRQGVATTVTAESAAPTSAAAGREYRTVRYVRLDDHSVNPVTARFILEELTAAEKQESVFVLELDTPGGLLQSTREIVKGFLSASVPVIVFVGPDGSRAASAGVFITIAAHVAAMAPSTHIGAATPVSISGSGEAPKKPKAKDATTTAPATPVLDEDNASDASDSAMRNKVLNDTIAWAEATAQARHRNVQWVKDTVIEARSSTADEALRLGAIDVVARDVPDLLRQIDGRRISLGGTSVTLRTAGQVLSAPTTMNSRTLFLSYLASPGVAYLLIIFGVVGLAIEFKNPGGIIPGVAGLVCLLLAGFAINILPVSYSAIVLIVVGVLMILAELKFPTFGVLTIAGAVCMAVGGLALVDQPQGFQGVPASLAIGGAVSAALVLGVLVALVAKAHRSPVLTGKEGLIGEVGEARTLLAPRGKVYVSGTYWDAVVAGGNGTIIPEGAVVQVVAVHGMRLEVEEVHSKLQ